MFLRTQSGATIKNEFNFIIRVFTQPANTSQKKIMHIRG